MATMNSGLLAGLVFGGWITGISPGRTGGICTFTILTLLPLAALLVLVFSGNHRPVSSVRESPDTAGWSDLIRDAGGMVVRQAPLWYSVIILLGITGFIQAVFPELSDLSSSETGIALACMNLATIIATLFAPRFQVEPVLLIRISSVLMGGLVLAFISFPASIFLMGGVAGLIIISQINYLAFAEEHQGVAMGIYSTSSYAGMTIIPALGGYLTSISTVDGAAMIISILALICAVTIGRCRCRGFIPPSD
jgi:predicted MFS family arabinose efflux permease